VTALSLLGVASRGAETSVATGTRPVVMLLAMAALSLLPFVVLLMTSFVRIVVVLSILKSALGAPQVPPAPVLTGLALILTVYVMAPTGERMYRAVEPTLGRAASAEPLTLEGLAALGAAARAAGEPLREFLIKHGAPRDRALFFALARRMRPPAEQGAITDRDLLVLAPAFLVSELRRAFEIGFLLFVPFLVIDMIVANLLLALGMHMLSPTTVSLPFKLLLFVLADGWQLVIRGLLESYA
jgi:type III secretion protein R